jgi:hypothetical protein
MAITQLSLYNGALRKIKERKLATLSENRESRRLLDDAFDGHIKMCLEAALWRFARRTKLFTSDTEYTPEFGHKYRFTKPDDFVRTIGVFHDDRLNSPVLQYLDEGGYWYSDIEEIYISYVSMDTDYGANYSLWSESFREYVEWELAYQIVGRLSQSTVTEADAMKRRDDTLMTAKSNSAMEGPSVIPPTGRWVNSRRNGSQGDRGSRGRLIG